MIVLGYDKDSEMFNIKNDDKFYLRSDGSEKFPGSFCNGIHYLDDEEELPPRKTVSLLNRIYKNSCDGKRIIDNFLEEMKEEELEEWGLRIF